LTDPLQAEFSEEGGPGRAAQDNFLAATGAESDRLAEIQSQAFLQVLPDLGTIGLPVAFTRLPEIPPFAGSSEAPEDFAAKAADLHPVEADFDRFGFHAFLLLNGKSFD